MHAWSQVVTQLPPSKSEQMITAEESNAGVNPVCSIFLPTPLAEYDSPISSRTSVMGGWMNQCSLFYRHIDLPISSENKNKSAPKQVQSFAANRSFV
jgi:hypothetical protein